VAARGSATAVQEFVDLLQRAVSCVTDSVLTVGGGYHPSDTPHVLLLNNGDPVRLAGESRLALSVIHHYWVVRDRDRPRRWAVSTAAYYYTLQDAEGREVLSYHWHPSAGVGFPHMHIRAEAQVGPKSLHKYHLPTNRVTLEAVLRLAITELGVTVRPQRAEDWEAVLNETESVHEERRTWPRSGRGDFYS
jgi:hypothetical protein